MPPIINKKKCVGCFSCAENCPVDVFGHQKKDLKIPQVKYPDECWHCNACVIDCPMQAISLRIPVPLMMVYVDAPKKDANTK